MQWHTRWQHLWLAFGITPAPAALLPQLLACYTEPHRHYHTLQHLEECLLRLDAVRSHADQPALIELALWFHDAIYDPHNADNEARSATWAHDSAMADGLSSAVAHRLAALVLTTRDHISMGDRDAALLLDLDLSILAAPPARFTEYETQIRAEYAWVPEPTYQAERRKVLLSFAQRPTIYQTAACRDRWEVSARRNLARSLAEIGKTSLVV